MKSRPRRRSRDRAARVRSKHIVGTDQEDVDKAVELVSAEEDIIRVLASARGLRGMEELAKPWVGRGF